MGAATATGQSRLQQAPATTNAALRLWPASAPTYSAPTTTTWDSIAAAISASAAGDSVIVAIGISAASGLQCELGVYVKVQIYSAKDRRCPMIRKTIKLAAHTVYRHFRRLGDCRLVNLYDCLQPLGV